MKGQGGGGTAKGGGKTRSGGGTVTIQKTKALKTTANDNILRLRAALKNDQGKDKDVTAGLAAAFLTFKIPATVDQPTEKILSIHFSPKLSKSEFKWAFALVKENMEDKYDIAGYGWDDEDKESELTEQGARFLLVRDATNDNKIIAFVHFRFTVQGEVMDVMQGDTCVFVFDIHIEKEYQRKGLGKHLLIVLELIARREQMTHVLFPVYLKDNETKTWLLKQGKGYALDESLESLGFEAKDEGYEVYTKVFPPPVVRTLAPPVPTAPAPPLTPAPLAPPAHITQPTPAPTSVTATHSPIEDGPIVLPGSVDVDEVIAELKKVYISEHDGATPTDEMVSQWKSEVENLQTLELLHASDVVMVEKSEEDDEQPAKDNDEDGDWVKIEK